MNQTKTVSEQISALADGQLQGDEFAALMQQVGERPELRSTWETYHLVGDVLRSGVHAPCSDSSSFLSKLQVRLAAEQISLVQASPVAQDRPVIVAEAANEPVFRWKLLAGAASLAAAAAIGWTWVGTSAMSDGAQLAQQHQGKTGSVLAVAGPAASGAAVVSSPRVLVGKDNEAQVMLRDPRLDELLQAHQQVGGASHMPSVFLRNATFDAPSR
jgi:sigma-E factor negative regulatory protein RseA